MNLPEDYPHEEKKVGFEWYAPYRYRRIAEVLRNNPSFGLEDSVKLQTDYHSVPTLPPRPFSRCGTACICARLS
jgi:penicillin G amidase